MCGARVDGNQKRLRRTLLDLFNKSGHGHNLGKMIYSDKDKNTDVTQSAAFSMLAECTPEGFYEILDKKIIVSGLLPRFTIIEYKGKRPELNEGHEKVKPSRQLTDYFSSICAYSLQLNNGNNVLNVEFDEESKKHFSDFGKYCTAKVNEGNEVHRQLWTRAHIKALKLAALLAVGVNYINPIVNMECCMWALNLIKSDVTNILSRFESGDIGTSSVQNDQIIEVKKAFKRYLVSEWDDLAKVAGATLPTWNLKLIPHSYISASCRTKACFKNDKLGPVPALKVVIQSMIDCGEIQELGPQEKLKKGLSATSRVYLVSDLNKLNV
jgi:hypothetical protein